MALTKLALRALKAELGTTSIADDAITIPKLAATGTASSTNFLRGDNSWVEVGGAYNDFLIKDADFTCAAKDQIVCNHASTAFTITLPASPTATQSVVIANAGAALVTVGRNGSNINSASENGTLPKGNSVQLVFVSSAIGWFAI